MPRSNKPQPGDIYEIPLGNSKKAYMQYIGEDATQLYGDVVRVFQQQTSSTEAPSLHDLVRSPEQFCAHIYGVKYGIQDRLWQKIGQGEIINADKIRFRDFADPDVLNDDGKWVIPAVSKSWDVWYMNSERRHVKQLTEELAKAYPGPVIAPHFIIDWIKEGKKPYKYPDYK